MQPAHITSGARKCPKCGTELHDGVLGGQCPACATRLVCQTDGAGETAVLLAADGKPRVPTDVVPLRYFGDYELLGEVGRGGMGIVYKARQLSLHRVVALKLITPEQLAFPKAVERFHTEAEAAALLDHPNIVPIYETGERDGRHYFSMKLIEGQSLALRMADLRLPSVDSKAARPDASPLPGGEGRGEGGHSAYSKSAIRHRQSAIASLLAKVADAVHYAHQRGILHRDLKPGNILIDAAGEPHVTDFGLAKLVEGDSSLTLSGEVLGTPAYMAPEQAAGNAKQMTTAADIYSLGVILYELLTGRTPFRGESPVETLHALLYTEPEAPRSLNRAVPRDLETLCLKCLEKEPARRYTSARALAEDLRRFVNDEPVQARPIGPAGKAWRWCRRKPALAATSLVLLIVLALGLAGILWEWQRARQNALIVGENLYAANMNVVQQAWDQNNIDRLRQLLIDTQDSPYRGFEWYYWQPLTHLSLKTLRGHLGGVASVVFSPDGRWIVTGSEDKTAKVWEVASGQELLTLKGHSDGITSVAFSPNGQRIVTGSWDATAKVWEAASGRELLTLQGPRAAISSVGFSPDGQRIVTGSVDATARVWDAASGKELLTLKGHSGWIWSVAFSPDGQRIVTGSFDRTAKVWEAARGRELLSLTGHSGGIWSATFSPDGQRIVTGSCDCVARVWETARPEQVAAWQEEERAAAQYLAALQRERTAERERQSVARARESIKQWLILAPIHLATGQSGAEGLDIEQIEGEAQLRPQAGESRSIGGRELKWREVALQDYEDNVINFNAILGQVTDYSVAYAVCYLQSETEQRGLRMLVGSQEEAKVHLNGKQVYKAPIPHGIFAVEDTVPDLALNAGLNVLVFKVVTETRRWKGSIRFTNAAGEPVKGIRVTLTPR